MKRYIIYFSFFWVCLATTTYAQQNASNQHYWITPSILNPALIGLSGDSSINLSTSVTDYWSVMPNAPRVLDAVLEIPIVNERISLGAFFRQEEYFLVKESKGSIAINYQIPWKNNHTEFRFGLELGFIANRMDFSNVSVKDLSDELILEGVQNATAFQFSFALAFRHKRFKIGVNIPYLMSGKNQPVGSFLYGNNDRETVSLRKPLGYSLYIEQNLFNKHVNVDTHALKIIGITTIHHTLGSNLVTVSPFDAQIAVNYRFGGFKIKKKTPGIKLNALKTGLGYRINWKNAQSEESRIGHTMNALVGLELSSFLELDYIMGININPLNTATLGTTHEIVCKFFITKNRNKNKALINKQKKRLDLLENDFSDQINESKEQYTAIGGTIDSLQKNNALIEEQVQILQNKILTLKEELKQIEGVQKQLDRIHQQILILMLNKSTMSSDDFDKYLNDIKNAIKDFHLESKTEKD